MEGAAAVILAAVRGTGFGGAMALASWRGVGLVRRHVELCRSAGIGEVIVVLGPMWEEVLARVDTAGATVVGNDDFEEGEASSLRAGLDTLWRMQEIETAVLVELARPALTVGMITAAADPAPGPERPMKLVKYRYARGGPVAVDRSLWPRLMGLEGSVDLVDLAAAHPEWVEEVRIDSPPPARVDSAVDLSELRPPGRLT